ncbi:MAG TPA: hypothetical protein VFZ43_04840 [Anaerolineales bacterium]
MLKWEYKAQVVQAPIQLAEGDMVKVNHLFNHVIAAALLLIVGLTARETTATTAVAARKGSSDPACASLPSRYSITMDYVQERGVWVIYTGEGPTGVNGGLVQLLSDYRTCSK